MEVAGVRWFDGCRLTDGLEEVLLEHVDGGAVVFQLNPAIAPLRRENVSEAPLSCLATAKPLRRLSGPVSLLAVKVQGGEQSCLLLQHRERRRTLYIQVQCILRESCHGECTCAWELCSHDGKVLLTKSYSYRCKRSGLRDIQYTLLVQDHDLDAVVRYNATFDVELCLTVLQPQDRSFRIFSCGRETSRASLADGEGFLHMHRCVGNDDVPDIVQDARKFPQWSIRWKIDGDPRI